MEKLENKNDLYYVYELNESLNEQELRKLLLQNEVEHIQNNLNDYITDKFDIEKQCETIKNCFTLPLENIINELETWHAYSIEKLEYNTYITDLIIKPTAEFVQVHELMQILQNYYARDFVQVKDQSIKFLENEIQGFYSGFRLTVEHRSNNIDIEKIEKLLTDSDIVLKYNYQIKSEV